MVLLELLVTTLEWLVEVTGADKEVLKWLLAVPLEEAVVD